VNLSRIGEIAAQLKNPCIVHAEQEGKTLYELQWRLNRPAETEAPSPVFKGHPPDNVRHYYDEIRRRMSRVFSKKESLHDALFKKNPQDAIFLQKTDAVVQAHIADEDFDTGYLAKALAMSRMSLHRKLKTITGKAPADYIRQLRLEKAKQLIEASDSTIGEVSFQVGFQSQSHFTRAFVSHFGVRPTAYKKGK
jgi:AraC-like DNA-binding protein